MAFDEQTKKQVEVYVRAHIRDDAWHLSYFDFIDNAHLAKRLGEGTIPAAPPNDYTTSSILCPAIAIAFMSALLACSKLVC